MAVYTNEAGKRVRYRRAKTSGYEVAQAWVEGVEPEARYRSVFFEGRKIFDYGYHFCMGIKGTDRHGEPFVLLNGDSYSVSTSKHQGDVRGAVAASGVRSFIIPFSALRSAGIQPEGVEPLDYEGERVIKSRRRKYTGGYDFETGAYTPRVFTGEYEEWDGHLLGSTLFTAPFGRSFRLTSYRGNGYLSGDATGEGHFLSGLDEGAVNPTRGHFLVQLPHAVERVDQAYECLKPNAVREADLLGVKAQRQGEWFFLPVDEAYGDELDALDRKGQVLRGQVLPDVNSLVPGHHVASKAVVREDGAVFVKGYVRHSGGDHKQLHLKSWHRAYRNRALQSWSTGGRVD